MAGFRKVEQIAKKFLDSEKIASKLVGALIGGSWARGEATSESDIDLMLVYKDKYKSKFESVHSKETEFEGYPISVIFQSRSNIASYLKEPDPSVISFLKEGVIIYDPRGNLKKWIQKAKKIKIFKNAEWKRESKRRLKERIDYNIKKIEQALAGKNTILATYVLRGIMDEIVEKFRMYDGDWLYSQRKSNLNYLNDKKMRTKKISSIFSSANQPLEAKEIKYLASLLRGLTIK